MTNIEKNILVANFVGRRGKVLNDLFYFYDEISGVAWHTEKELKFDKDWNWLMKAIEKMWSITGHRSLFYQTVRLNDTDNIMEQENITIFCNLDDKMKSTIKEAFSLVIKFLESNYYKEFKKKIK